jgi:agmatinase
MDNNPWAELATDDIDLASVLVKGVPFDGAASVGKGAYMAPYTIRSLSKFLPPITEEGVLLKDFYLKDYGDFEIDVIWERFFQTVEAGATDLIMTGKFCIFLGGDHSVGIPLENAFLNMYAGKKLGVIHFDSHSDILNEYESMRWSHACTQRRALENGNLKDEGLTLVGIRSWEAEELEFLASHPDITTISAIDIYENGVRSVIDRILAHYEGYDAVYLTLDIDVLDPCYAPGTGTPECGGLSTRELLQIIKSLVRQLPVKAMDIVEVSPPLDSPNNITSWAALKVIYEVLGQLYLKSR